MRFPSQQNTSRQSDERSLLEKCALLLKNKSYEQALLLLKEILIQNPNQYDATMLSGEVHRNQQQFTEAVFYYKKAIEIKPNNLSAFLSLSTVLMELKEYEEAWEMAKKAETINPNEGLPYLCQSLILINERKYSAALEVLDKTIAIEPQWEIAHAKRAVALENLHRYKEAQDAYFTTVQLSGNQPLPKWNYGTILLKNGIMPEGWQWYEHRWELSEFSSDDLKFPFPRWDGVSSLKNKSILIRHEQGMGDTLQFCRYVTLLAERGAQVVFLTIPELKTLIESLSGVSKVVLITDPIPVCDYEYPLMSLPFAFQTHLSTIPRMQAYLCAPDARRDYWKNFLKDMPGLRVGLTWRGAKKHKDDQRRSLPFSALAPHLLPHVSYISLQKEVAEEDVDALRQSRVRDVGDALTDAAETTALCQNLDLVLSVDTSVAHLAGAAGTPVWIMLHHNAEWRWMTHRSDTPWYPQARLYRQETMGDWDEVLQRVTHDLREQVPPQHPA